MGSGLEVGRYGGGAALKAGQPWVPAAELSLWEVGGCCLTCQVRTNRACSIPPSVSQEDSVDHDNSPVISARSLGSCQTVTRELRSEALTTPTSLAPSHTPHPCLRACLLGREGVEERTVGQGLPTQGGPPEDQGLSAQAWTSVSPGKGPHGCGPEAGSQTRRVLPLVTLSVRMTSTHRRGC